MKQLNALFFPETLPSEKDLSPLLLLCDRISYYALPPTAAGAWLRSMQEKNLCCACNPTGLTDEEQKRFQDLVREVKGHEEEFYGGALSSLASAYRDRDEATAWSLVARMRSGQKAPLPTKTPEGLLWREMFILKLAEMLAEDERVIAEGLANISDKETELLAAIKGYEETEDEEELDLTELAAPQPLSMPALDVERLARAWGALYLGDSQTPADTILVTSHPELQTLLADTYETLAGKPSLELTSISLPVPSPAEEAFLGQRQKIKASRTEAHENLLRLLAEAAASKEISPELRCTLAKEGREMTTGAPAGRILTFYAYEGKNMRQLFSQLCDRELPAAAAGLPPETGILAVLR